MKCKSYLAGASLSAMMIALTAAGHAADYTPAPTYDWSGFYIGAHAGYGDIDSDGFFATSVDLQFGGGDFIGGGQAGWNIQRNSWVFGVETDFSFLEWQGKNVREEHYIAEADFLATLRGRVGWADDNVLFYATAGGALLNAEATTSVGGQDLDQQGNTDGKDVSALGIALGAGIEWGMTRNLSVKAEGLYLLFDSFSSLVGLDEGCSPADPENCLDEGPPNNFSVDDGFVFRLGANWRFGGGTDGPEDEEALAATVASHDWSGFYLGLHAGYGGFDTDGIYINEDGLRVTASGETVPVLLEEFDNHGLLGGVQIGFNWQVGSLLLGVEGDISGVDWNNVLPDVQVPVEPVIMALDVDFLATARARAGWVRNDMLYYLTGGVAFMESELSVRAASLNGTLTDPDSKDISAIAPVIGGGIEWKYTPNLSIKAEGLYLMFDEDVDLSDLQGSGRPGDHIEIDDGFMFRLGANWQLWPQGSDTETASYAAAEVTHPGPRYDWTGFYVGGHVGWGGLVTDGLFNPNWDGAQQLTANQAIDLTGVNDLGVLGGGQVGFNWQTGPLVFGVEGDIAAVDWDGTETEFFRPQDHMDFNSDYIATARARVGYADDNLLFYATAGLAYVNAGLDNTGNSEVIPVPVAPGEDEPFDTGILGTKKDVSTWGGAAGLGMEWGITQNLSAKIDGLFLFFDDTTNIEDLGPESDPGDYFHLDDGFVVRVGANWRFNPFNRDLGDQSDYVGGTAALAEAGEGGDPADEASAGASDGGEGEAGPWKVSGIINRAALFWDDGEESDVYLVDNPQDSSAIEIEGEFDLGHGWTGTLGIIFDIFYASADSVDQLDSNGEGLVIELPYNYAQFSHDNWGTLIAGFNDTASDEIDNINLAEADAVADASFENFVSNFYLRAEGIAGNTGLVSGLPGAFNDGNGDVRWGDFIVAKFSGESGRVIHYISPEYMGFTASAAVAQPQDLALTRDGDFQFSDRDHGVFADAALRYAGDWGNQLKIAAGVGVWRDTAEEVNALEKTEDTGLGASIAALHMPTGINFAVNYAVESFTDDCFEPGAVSGDCRGNDEFLYVKGGIVRDFVEWGPTAFYGEHYWGWKEQNESDPGVLASLTGIVVEDPLADPPIPETRELSGSTVTGWGAGVVQHIKAYDTEVYVGYRNYELDVDILAPGGVSIPSLDFEDLHTLVVGVTIHWGGGLSTDADSDYRAATNAGIPDTGERSRGRP